MIVKNFHKITNYKKLRVALDVYKTRMIATSNVNIDEAIVDDFFSLKILIPPLSKRQEDIAPLMEKFSLEARLMFDDAYGDTLSIENIVPDVSKIVIH